MADAAGIGTLEIKAMRKARLRPETAAAITAASATIGPIIPPSLPMVIYGVTADVSIGRLFLAGVIPGLLMGAVADGDGRDRRARAQACRAIPSAGFGGIWSAFREAFWALMTPVILFGGMFSGYLHADRSRRRRDLYALFLGFVVYRDSRSDSDLPAILVDTAETTGVVMALVMAAGALGWCMSISRMPQTLAPAIVDAIQQPAGFPAGLQPDPAGRRLLHGSAGRDADPDPDPGAGRASASASIRSSSA